MRDDAKNKKPTLRIVDCAYEKLRGNCLSAEPLSFYGSFGNSALIRNYRARAVVRALFEQGEGLFDHFAAVIHFLVVRKRRVTEYMEDAVAAKYPVRAYTLGDFR